jgi:hypothetical protein
MNRYISVTGNTRSGTTLLEKLIGGLPDVEMFSQPFPQLFIDVKKKYYEELSHPEKYFVLGNFYQDKLCQPDDVSRYLNNNKYSSKFIMDSIRRDYSGQLTRGGDKWVKENSTSGTFSETYKHLLDGLSSDSRRTIGSKHVMCEEYIPHLLNNNIKCINIIRDPRDMLVSAKFGKSSEYIGKTLPTLFELRNWRKSAEYIVEHSSEKDFFWLRYEDLVTEPNYWVGKIYEFINSDSPDLNDLPDLDLGISEQKWQGNSSFGTFEGISNTSVGNYTEYFSEDMVNYIETICQYEMKIFGYIPEDKKLEENGIRKFVEPIEVKSPNIEHIYSYDLKRIEFEIERLVTPQRKHFCFGTTLSMVVEKLKLVDNA